jgi:hypothetical protein
MEHSEGLKYWYKNGMHHRDNGLPATIYPNGERIWYKNGNFIKQKKD